MQVEFERASARFGELTAVEGASLSVAAGEQVALVGPSGSGKTTLLRMIGGGVRAADGVVSVGGQSLTDLSPAALRALRSRLGTIPQHLALVPNLRVVQNVLSGRLGQQGFLGGMKSILWPARREVEAAHALLERVGIGEKLYHRTDTLSGGQQQRVAIARALYQQPAILLADEPVASVDPARARDVMRLLLDISHEQGLTLVVSLHDLALAREFFPRLVGLRSGRVEIDGQTAGIDAAAFDALYDLSAAELVADGA